MITRFLTTHTLRGALLLGGLCMLTLAANAQSTFARATVPFEFAAAGEMMPAGEYTVEVPDLSGVLVLRGVDKNGSTTTSVALLATLSGVTPSTTKAKLIFERRDGMAYLSAVEWPEQNAKVTSVFKHVTKGAVAAALR
jgi:hypothetical protein